jgi:hypothetical protein
MDIKFEGKFMEELRKILEYPPYLIFVFVSAIFVCITLIKGNYFEQIWIFFLYSVIGSIWRYIEKDIMRNVLKEGQVKTWLVIYHIGNFFLFFALLFYLKII